MAGTATTSLPTREHPRRRRRSGTALMAGLRRNTLSTLVLVVMVVAIVAPIGFLVWGALWSDQPVAPGAHFTWGNIRDVYGSPGFLRSLRNTALLAVAVSTIVTVVGTALAIIFVRVELYFSGLLRLGLMAPLFVSPFVATVAWVTLYAKDSGLVDHLLVKIGLPQFNLFSVHGTIILMAVVFLPYGFILLTDAMARTNEETEDAARVCGASLARTLRAVTIPSLTPALVSVFTITFVLSAEMFAIPGLLAARERFFTLSYQIYFQTVRYPINLPAAAAGGLALIAISVIGIGIHLRMTRLSSRYVTVSGKPPSLRKSRVSKRTRVVLSVLVALYILVTLVVPLLALILRSLTPYFSGSINWTDMSLRPYADILSASATQQAIKNSLFLCLVAAVLAVALAGYVGHHTVRSRGLGSRLMNVVANLPLGLPGTVLGVGLIWTFIGTPVYATLIIVALGIYVRWLPVTVRVVQTSVMQISPEFGQAADVAGASTAQKTRLIHAPLMRSGLAACALMAFVFTFNEITSTALLATGQTTTVPMMVFNYMFDGNYPKASVIAVVQTLIMGLFAVALMGLLSNRGARRKADRVAARGRPTPHDDDSGRSDSRSQHNQTKKAVA